MMIIREHRSDPTLRTTGISFPGTARLSLSYKEYHESNISPGDASDLEASIIFSEEPTLMSEQITSTLKLSDEIQIEDIPESWIKSVSVDFLFALTLLGSMDSNKVIATLYEEIIAPHAKLNVSSRDDKLLVSLKLPGISRGPSKVLSKGSLPPFL